MENDFEESEITGRVHIENRISSTHAESNDILLNINTMDLPKHIICI
jgi:hypothetical protein